MNVGEALREQREKAGLTLGQVGKYEGLTPQYLSDLERGRNNPKVWSLLARLAKRYGCSTDYLLGLTDDPTPNNQASDIQVMFDRLSSARQKDLLQQADLWLADEDEAYRVEFLQKWVSQVEDGLDVLRELIDDEADLPPPDDE